MSIDVSKIKPGDEVTLRVAVAFFHEGELGRFVVTDAGVLVGMQPAFDVARIVSHTPKVLGAGDRVRVRCGGGAIATVKHIIGSNAWVEWDTAPDGRSLPAFTHEVRHIAVLERVDQ